MPYQDKTISRPASLFTWLRDLGCTDIRMARVHIGRTSYQGCFYKQTRTTDPGTRAYAEGERSYVIEALYLVGPLPASYRRSRRVVYRLPGDDRDWYVCGYYPAEGTTPEPNDYHPFGQMVQLQPWSVPSGDSIDRYEWTERKYKRIGIAVHLYPQDAQDAEVVDYLGG